MDRMISLLAALVGLIALGGAILVHTNGDVQRTEMASQIAQLKVSVDLLTQQTAGGRVAQAPVPALAISSAEPPISEYVAAELTSSSAPPSSGSSSLPPPPLLASSSASPSGTSSQASVESPSSSAEAAGQVADVKVLQGRIASLEAAMSAQASQLDAAKAQPTLPGSSSDASAQVAAVTPPDGAPAAIAADGPTKDCIPIGTRFMATSGDNFPICKTKVVVKVASVSDGFATIGGAGDVSAGASGTLAKGCNIMVFSADTTGYAEMRVTCQ